MTQVLRGIRPGLNIREIIVQVASTEAFHTGDRLSVEDLRANYRIDETLTTPEPTNIGIFDDVLTAGTHFRAVHDMLSERFPRSNIVGFFLARRVFPPPAIDFDNIDF